MGIVFTHSTVGSEDTMIATQGPFRGKLEIAFFAPVVKEIPCPRGCEGGWTQVVGILQWVESSSSLSEKEGHFPFNHAYFLRSKESSCNNFIAIIFLHFLHLTGWEEVALKIKYCFLVLS